MGLALAAIPPLPATAGPVAETTLFPAAIVDQIGSHTGTVSALAAKDQRGGENDAARYVQFGVTGGEDYQGYRSYFLPGAINPAGISTLTLIANVLGPSTATDAFTWSLYDWTTQQYEPLGTQNNCGGATGRFACGADKRGFKAWKWLQYTALGRPLSNYVNPGTGELRVLLSSANATSYLSVDFESLSVFSNSGSPGPPWVPPADVRWQWQIQAKAGRFPATGGIDVDVCEPSFLKGPCVQPDVFDIDLYVDGEITETWDGNTVSGDYVVATDALAAIHASGRRAIGYITVGDAENFRPDFQQMVDFDASCGGCFLGNAFSKTFPNEWYVNINNDAGQADFMLKMVQARIDRVAAAGFDSLEPDVDFISGNDSGFAISDETQILYNLAVAAMAHADGLSLALKSAVDLAGDPRLVAAFDYVIDEQCFQYKECAGYAAFQGAGKAIFNAEYKLSTKKFCADANAMNFNSIRKAKNFNLYDQPWKPCR